MDLSIVVPAYREGPRIYENLTRLLGELDQIGRQYEVLVISDGNTDGTVAEARRVRSPRVKVLHYPINLGKGFALSYGVWMSTGNLVTFIDADMELNPRAIKTFLSYMDNGDYDIVLGSKRHPDSIVSYPAFRRMQSWVYQGLVRILFQLNVRDTQTGLKLIKRNVLMNVVPLLAVKKFAFDLELMVVASHLGYSNFREAPIELDYQFSSTTNVRAAFRVLWDTAAIFYRLRIRRYYNTARLVVAKKAWITEPDLSLQGPMLPHFQEPEPAPEGANVSPDLLIGAGSRIVAGS
jgi:glycosyltransferase involved in cell wall biosynthesis